MGNRMDDRTAAELAALADATLTPERREALLARPELAAQRSALTAIRATETVRAPDRLHAAVAALEAADAGAVGFAGPPRRSRRWRLPAVSLTAVTAAVIAVLVLALGGSEPTVAEAAKVALSPATRPAPAQAGNVLNASVDGVAYPYFGDQSDWQATGTRADTVDGRRVMTVVYANPHGQRVGYAIADGSALPVKGGTLVGDKRVIHDGDTTIVTWLRNGHTCILAARGVSAPMLVALANWA